jgi:hypothetical protein
MKVYNSTLTSHGAPFDPQEEPSPEDTAAKYLEIRGNSRVHITKSNSYSYFYYCNLIADGWGVLSTDASGGFVYLEANNCKVQTIKSGYGTYADGLCHNFFNNCDFDVASMATVMAGESDCEFNNTNAKCGTYFALLHSVRGNPDEVGTLKVTGGEIECASPAVYVKSQNAVIHFDRVKMAVKDGILLKSVFNDDPNATKINGHKCYGIHASFLDMDISGDIVHEDPDRDMWVYLDATTLKGGVKDAYISIDPSSKWIATSDSEVTIIGGAAVSQIDALPGVTITAYSGEEGTHTLESGGKLILKTL